MEKNREILLASATEIDPVIFGPEARAIIDEWLAGIEATRSGLFTTFFIEMTDDHTGRLVTQENADEIEASIRDHFAPNYPELIETTRETV